jgi:hypothetical protein
VFLITAGASFIYGRERMTRQIHPSTTAILKYFDYAHLPPHLQLISKPFGDLAADMATILQGPELTAGLRKLLEAKDCMVRAALTPTPTATDPVP